MECSINCRTPRSKVLLFLNFELTVSSWNLIDDGCAARVYSCSATFTLARLCCAKMRRTSPVHILAFALCVPLLALAVPTASPYQLPPALDPEILKLVLRNAINISTHRSVDVPDSFLSNAYNGRLVDSWELGALAEALTEYEWPELAVFTSGSIPPPTQLNGLGADVHPFAETCVFFLHFSFPAAGVDACLLRLNAGSLRTRHPVPFHSSMAMVPSGILLVSISSLPYFLPLLLIPPHAPRSRRCCSATQLDIAQ